MNRSVAMHAKSSVMASAPPLVRVQAPKICFDSITKPMLTDEIEQALNGLLRVMIEYSIANKIPSPTIEVTGFTDPDEGADHIIISQEVKMDAKPAITYWDNLGDTIECWARSLDTPQAEIVLKKLTTHVRWNTDAA